MKRAGVIVSYVSAAAMILAWAWVLTPVFHQKGALWGPTKAQEELAADKGPKALDAASSPVNSYEQCGNVPCGGGSGSPGQPIVCHGLYEGATAYDCNNPPPDLAHCFHVHLSKVDDKTYLQDSRNTCGRELKDVYVLVKFLDADGRRIGVSHFEAHYVAKGEHLYKSIPTLLDTSFEKVQVRFITSDPAEGAK